MRNETASYRAAVHELEGLVHELERQRQTLRSELAAREKMCVALQCSYKGPQDLRQAMFSMEKELKKAARLRVDSETYLEEVKARERHDDITKIYEMR